MATDDGVARGGVATRALAQVIRVRYSILY
jgi:hypothetical protein